MSKNGAKLAQLESMGKIASRVLPGNVHLHRNVALECRVIGGKRDAIFPLV